MTGPTPRWSIVGLLLAMVLCVAWRWHTIGPTPIDRWLEGWLVRSGEAEPLDCDEAAYAYIGRRILRGDVLYRDLTENKPPLGYWLYTLAVGLGGGTERAIRVMPIPYILATIAGLWWLGLRLAGPGTACLAAFAFAIAGADPYVFGNGSNMEHFMNLFAVGSLAAIVRALDRDSRRWLVVAGALVGLECLVKPFAATHGLVYAIFVLAPGRGRSIRARIVDAATLLLGFVVPWAIAVGALMLQGAGASAYVDIIQFARATATDLPSPANAPPKLLRWVVGNADPDGRLPWPFGRTTYYAWWGAGLWPLWLASLPATARLILGGRVRSLLAAWVASCWVQVLLPGQFWQHYYLLPLPGAVLAVAIGLGDAVGLIRSRRAVGWLAAVVGVAAVGWSLRIQARDYLGKTPDEITGTFKGGNQWVALRRLGLDLAGRARGVDAPGLFVWGWQSPLYFYSGLDSPSRHFFANELLKAHAGKDHPLVGPWSAEVLRDLRARPPAFILAGDIPFPALRKFLDEGYLPSLQTPVTPDGRGLWIIKTGYGSYSKPHP